MSPASADQIIVGWRSHVVSSCRQLLVENYALSVGTVSRTLGGGQVSVPEPGTLTLLAAGLLGAGLARRRRRPA